MCFSLQKATLVIGKLDSGKRMGSASENFVVTTLHTVV